MTVPNNANTYLPPTVVEPVKLLIGNITRSYPAVVTVTTTNDYVAGQLVHFTVPSSYKMFQMNQLTAQIMSINGLDISVDIDSTGFDTFVTPATYQPQPASLSPAGSRNLYNIEFVPFHNLNNQGN